MRRWAKHAATAVIAFSSAAASAAQDREATRVLSDQHAAQELGIYADCVARQRVHDARALALAAYGSNEAVQAADRVTRGIDDNCIQSGFDNVRLAVRPDVLAGAVAEALLRKDYADLPSVVDQAAVDAEAERARAAQLSVAERFGRCIVWNDPAGVQAMLRSPAGSQQERTAMDALKDDMGMCLQEGSTLRLNRPFVRTVAAVAAYRLAQQLQPRGQTAERG